MKKPEKRKDIDHSEGCRSEGECGGCESIGFNDACEEWEEYHKQEISEYKRTYKLMCENINKLKQLLKDKLPSEDEIASIIWNLEARDIGGVWVKELTKAISERIRSEL